MIDKRRLTDVKVTYEVNTILSDLYNQIEYELRDDYNDSLEQLQSNWNSLREWLENKIDNFQDDVSEPILHEQMTIRVIYEYMENLDKMNELEGVNNGK